MFGPLSSKSKPSPKSKGNRRRNKQDRNDQSRDDQGRDDQGSNDQEWTKWEYSELYKQEWRDRIGPDGNREVQWRKSLETEETEEYEESAETDSTKYVEIPRHSNPIQIPKQRQGDDEVQLHEYTHKGEPDTEGTSSQHSWTTYHGQSISSPNTPSGFQGARPPWNPQPSPQGTRWPTVPESQLNTHMWKPQPNFQPPSMGAHYGSPPGQMRYPGSLGSHAPLLTSQGGYGDTGSTYPWQQNQGPAIGYGLAVNQANLHSSSASRTAPKQSVLGFGSLPPIHSGYPGGASGTGGPRQRGEDEEEYEDEVDFGDQVHGEGGTVPSKFSPPVRSSDRDTQLSQEYDTTVKSMAGLAFTKESTQELEGEVFTEEQSYGIEPSQVLLGSPGRPGRQAFYDPNDSQQGQYKQNQSRQGGYSGPPHTLNYSFQIQNSKLFKKFKVFKCLWSEPIGNVRKKYHSEEQSLPSIKEEFVTDAKYGETAFHGIRRFVIVKERKGHSLCVPILTYGSQGTKKFGVKAEYHAMIYTGQEVPSLLPGEQLVKRAVRMEPSSTEEKLDPKSRVNYAKVYTIEHNIRVCFIGRIHADSRATFETDFKAIDDEDVNES